MGGEVDYAVRTQFPMFSDVLPTVVISREFTKLGSRNMMQRYLLV